MGGRMVDFGGWDMPVQYPSGTIEEHLRTRTHAGVFDVSHMGEIDVRGPEAIAFVNRLTSNDVTKLVDGVNNTRRHRHRRPAGLSFEIRSPAARRKRRHH
jgi:glycine cleavage system aminomethyltransferase T